MPSRRKAAHGTSILLDLPQIKLQALAYQLTKKGSSLTAEINEYAETLYKKQVPKETQSFIDSMLGEGEPEPPAS